MDPAIHNKIVPFIWGTADDVLRDLFKRGKYPDVISADVLAIGRLLCVAKHSKRSRWWVPTQMILYPKAR